jgi:hypothetical protein
LYAFASNFNKALKPADIQSNGRIFRLTGINTVIITERGGGGGREEENR